MLSNIKPFKLCENVYFVGSTRVSVHLIDTEEGLVIIDTGYPDMLEQILESIHMLGFDEKNIVAIFHSHGHIDHFGTTIELKNLSGAKTYISRHDNLLVNGTKPLAWREEINLPLDAFVFDCDVLVDDGDVFKFGSTEIRCVLTPGHTAGVLSFFVSTNGVVGAMHGGIGFNTLSDDYINKHGLGKGVRQDLFDGLNKVENEDVDFVMGNHPQQSGTEQKLEMVERGESIINKGEWKHFIQVVKKQLTDAYGEDLNV